MNRCVRKGVLLDKVFFCFDITDFDGAVLGVELGIKTGRPYVESRPRGLTFRLMIWPISTQSVRKQGIWRRAVGLASRRGSRERRALARGRLSPALFGNRQTS
jgi:hypothetical protein